MNWLRTAGILWVVAALLAIAITLIFRIDAVQIVVTIAVAAVAAVLGLWIIVRPSTPAAPLSNVVGVAWLVLYAALTILQFGDLAAWATDVFLAVIGLGATLAVYRAPREAISRRP